MNTRSHSPMLCEEFKVKTFYRKIDMRRQTMHPTQT